MNQKLIEAVKRLAAECDSYLYYSGNANKGMSKALDAVRDVLAESGIDCYTAATRKGEDENDYI